MKAIVFLGLVCVPGFLGCVSNRGPALPSNHAAAMDSLPPAVKSLPVKIVPSFQHKVLAWSTAGMLESYVSYNPRIAGALPPEVLAFALVHEYGHLQLEHVSAFGNRLAASIREQELEADRFAATFWATNDVRVAQTAAASFLSPADARALGSERRSLEAGYPTRKERAQAILDCLAQTQQNPATKEPSRNATLAP